MVSEQYAFVRRNVVQAVVVPLGGRETVRIEPHHAVGDVEAVKTVGDTVNGYGGGNHPYRADLFASAEARVVKDAKPTSTTMPQMRKVLSDFIE